MSDSSLLPNYSLIPPYMLEEIINNGDTRQKDHASLTLIDINRLLITDPVPQANKKYDNINKNKLVRSISDAKNQESLPGILVRKEADPATSDIAVNEAYDYLGITYNFFWQKFGRRSLNNQGMPLDASVHYSTSYQNAFWNGERMVFGDGDGQIFNRFTIAIDIIAHELAHGVTESEAGFAYYGQSGALNESISDVFGAMVKQFHNNQTAAQADWIIGEKLLNSNINAIGLRSMSAPGTAYNDPLLGKDPQPDHMDNYISTRQDNGGVHLNSSIPNKAFCLAAKKLGGYSWEYAGKIWYNALCDKEMKRKADREGANFFNFAECTITHARLFSEQAARQVQSAWHEVGVW